MCVVTVRLSECMAESRVIYRFLTGVIFIDSNIIIALLGCLGTIIGSACGVAASSSKTIYRINQLEKKVDKHNNIVERMYIVEDKLKSHQHQINELKDEVKNND